MGKLGRAPDAAVPPAEWRKISAQQHTYARNRDQAALAATVLFGLGMGRSIAAVGGALGIANTEPKPRFSEFQTSCRISALTPIPTASMARQKVRIFIFDGAVPMPSSDVIGRTKQMKPCHILLTLFVCLSISACERAPTRVSEARFPSSGLSFEIRTRETGAPVANSHQIYVKPLSNMDEEEVLVFDGVGGDIPKILHRGGNRYIIQYAGALRYEVWAEKHVSFADDNGRVRTRILFFEVSQL